MAARSLFTSLPIRARFNLQVPKTCPNVDSNILMPSQTWADQFAFEARCFRGEAWGCFEPISFCIWRLSKRIRMKNVIFGLGNRL